MKSSYCPARHGVEGWRTASATLQTSLGGTRPRTGTGATDQRAVEGPNVGVVKSGGACDQAIDIASYLQLSDRSAGPWSGRHGGPNVRLCNAADNPMLGPRGSLTCGFGYRIGMAVGSSEAMSIQSASKPKNARAIAIGSASTATEISLLDRLSILASILLTLQQSTTGAAAETPASVEPAGLDVALETSVAAANPPSRCTDRDRTPARNHQGRQFISRRAKGRKPYRPTPGG